MHTSVLLHQSTEHLVWNINGTYVDGTLGRGGHTQEILNKLSAKGRVLGFDQDPEAVDFVKNRFSNESRLQVIQDNFCELAQYVNNEPKQLDGVLLDLGVSSPQLDEAHRGFSFQKIGSLDMRMNPAKGISAKDWLLQKPMPIIRKALQKYGNVKQASKWTFLIKRAATQGQLETTLDLANLISQHTPVKQAYRQRKHPATQIFQAIRIAVNDEISALEKLLQDSLWLLKHAGRLVVISFHSIEHRLLRKLCLIEESHHLPKGLPITEQQPWKTIQMLTYPYQQEIDENIRARSARLTVLQRMHSNEA